MGAGAVLIILGIILGFIWNWVIGIILIVLGLLSGGFGFYSGRRTTY